jgi:ABC-type nitrate/sulfonate/bicarbonate transport system permease component
VLALWHIMAVAYDLQQILPPPLSVARNVFNTLTLNYEQRWLYGPNIYEHLLSSFARAITGFTLAAALAIPLGLIVGRIRAVREFVDPVIRSLYPIPGIAWIPLAILWFGLGNTAVVFVVFIAEFFPLYFNTEAGATQYQPSPGRCRALLWSERRHPAPAGDPSGIHSLHHHRSADRAWGRLANDRGGRNAGVPVRDRIDPDGVPLPVPRD